MQTKSTAINIDGLTFTIQENLGQKGLVPPSELKALGTLIGELRKSYGRNLRTDLKQGKYAATDAISVTEVAESEMEKALSFWRNNSNQEPEGPWVALYVTGMPWHAYLPHTTLLKIVDQVEKLMSEESLPPEPPWLFREKPIAKYACRKEPFEDREEQILRTIENKITDFKIDNEGNLSDKTTGRELDNKHQFVLDLKYHGLFSARENLMKLYELHHWGFHNLERYYKRWLANPKNYGVSVSQSPQGISTKLFKELSVEPEKQELKSILELRKQLVTQLSDLGFLDELKDQEGRQHILDRLSVAPNLKHYLTGIGFLWEYIQSADRASMGKMQRVSEIINFPVSLEWFLHNRPPKDYSPFDWLAKCEKALRATAVDRAKHIFAKIDGKSVILYTANQDGTIPKLVSYSIN